ncbi:putative mycothiol conjugate amidase Mca [Streptomyces sp. Tu6071]|nr:putative mycothiol conjugate amidase Mca [Streptomyces sp. Tu6071]
MRGAGARTRTPGPRPRAAPSPGTPTARRGAQARTARPAAYRLAGTAARTVRPGAPGPAADPAPPPGPRPAAPRCSRRGSGPGAGSASAGRAGLRRAGLRRVVLRRRRVLRLLEVDLPHVAVHGLHQGPDTRRHDREDDEAEETGGHLVGVDFGEGDEVDHGLACARASAHSAIVTDARKEVVLGEGRFDQRLRQLEVLGRPDLLLDLHRDAEPAAVRVDLRGVRDERLVADLEVVGGRDEGGQRALGALRLLPALEPVAVRGLQAAREQRLVQRLGALAVEALVVVELRGLEDGAELRLGEALRVGRAVEGRHADPVGHDVVGVRVAPVLVVGRDDLRAEGADLAHEPPGRLLDVHEPEAALRERRQRVALGEAGVDVAEPRLLDAEDLAGLVHLLPADLVDVLLDVGVTLELRVEDGPALAPGAGDDQHVHPLRDVLRHRGGALAGLVVGVGVHGHQAQLLSQDSFLRCSSRRPRSCR